MNQDFEIYICTAYVTPILYWKIAYPNNKTLLVIGDENVLEAVQKQSHEFIIAGIAEDRSKIDSLASSLFHEWKMRCDKDPDCVIGLRNDNGNIKFTKYKFLKSPFILKSPEILQ